jgi:hypothetical protein
MNIKSTKCILRELSKKQIDTLIQAMPEDGLFDFGQGECLIGFSSSGRSGTWIVDGQETIVTYTEMMQLLGKTMQFTKSDLRKLAQTETVFVKQRNGNFKIVLGDDICGNDNKWGEINDYNVNMTQIWGGNELDIVAVYKKERGSSLTRYLKGQYLTLIWERTEQTPAQKEMKELQSQISKLQEQAKVLQSKL